MIILLKESSDIGSNTEKVPGEESVSFEYVAWLENCSRILEILAEKNLLKSFAKAEAESVIVGKIFLESLFHSLETVLKREL